MLYVLELHGIKLPLSYGEMYNKHQRAKKVHTLLNMYSYNDIHEAMYIATSAHIAWLRVSTVSQRFIVSNSSSGRLGGDGGRKVLWILIFFYCLCCPSSSSSLSLHYIVGLIAGGLETVRDYVTGRKRAHSVSVCETYT